MAARRSLPLATKPPLDTVYIDGAVEHEQLGFRIQTNCLGSPVTSSAQRRVSTLPQRFFVTTVLFREATRTDFGMSADEVDWSVHRRLVRCIENYPLDTCSLGLFFSLLLSKINRGRRKDGTIASNAKSHRVVRSRCLTRAICGLLSWHEYVYIQLRSACLSGQ
jgi:hypothetical protein